MGISIWQLLIILVIVIILFGTKRLRGLGSDLGNAIRSFRSAIKEEEREDSLEQDQGETIDTETGAKDNDMEAGTKDNEKTNNHV